MTPSYLLDLLAAVMLVVAGVSAARLVAARPWRDWRAVRDTDIAHLLMAVAMAGMLASSLSTLPGPAWDTVFALLSAWFAARVVRDARGSGVRLLAGGHCAPHLVHSAAMLYMFLALAAPMAGAGGMGAMSGMSSGPGATMSLAHPTVAFAFALVLAGYGVWDLDQLSGRRYHRAPAAPALAGAGAPGVPARAVPAAAVLAAGAAPAGSADGPAAGREPRPAGREPAARGGDGARDRLLSPAVTVGCRITMGVVMVFMLIIAI